MDLQITKRQSLSSRYFKIIAITICSFFSQVIHAQLSDFTLTVNPSNETCTANGTLNFTVNNTVPGSSIIYSIFALPNITTPIAVTSANTFTGLVAGNYRIVATQSLGGQSFSQLQDVTIANSIELLIYTLSSIPEVCGNDGEISFNVTNGVAVSYEIFSGPVIRPLQTSNVFSGLPGGSYLVRAFDSCGEGTARSFVLESPTPNITIGIGMTAPNSCDTFHLSTALSSGDGNAIAYPISATLTVIPPTGPPIVYNYTGLSNAPTQIIPAYFQPYSYNLTITDRCGNTFVRNDIPISITLNPQVDVSIGVVGCTGFRLLITTSGGMINPVTVNFTSAPADFNPVMYNPNHPGPFVTGPTIPIPYYNPTMPLPLGQYVVVVTDACGNTATDTITISNSVNPPAAVFFSPRPACQIGYGSLQIFGNLLSEIVMLSAPPSFDLPLPHDYSGDMVAGGILYLGPIPAGAYVFQTVDQCGNIRVTNVQINGYISGTTTGLITENCNSFNFKLQHFTNISATYFLQKLNPITGEWVHPITGDPGSPPTIDATNGLEIQNNVFNNNFQFTGNFRVIKRFAQFTTGVIVSPPCYELLYSFEYTGGPSINEVFTFACQDNTFDTIVITSGTPPLLYRITSKNGAPFFIDNGNTEIFLGLEAAVYNFQIEDGCGNVLNSLFDISTPTLLPITATIFCSGQNAALSVPAFPFLHYEWWKDGNPTSFLSTSSQLAFSPFNPAADNGIYHVHIYYDHPNSCIDYIYDYQIYVDPHIPDAGTGQTMRYCSNPGPIDLFTLLTGNFDTTGTWQEITGSNALNNNLWDASNVAFGDYVFTYTVTGLCGAFDQSTIIIELNATPESPVASLDGSGTFCENEPLYLYATAIPFGTYLWTGPNGFTSTAQNPVISNLSEFDGGTYTVTGLSEGCASASSSVEVMVNLLPDITIAAGCINNQYTLTASTVVQTTEADSVAYLWTGPNNYSSDNNPIIITDEQPGLYAIKATLPNTCFAVAEIEVISVMCSVPLGISPNNDGKNDRFDLSGFEVSKLEIFSRYGNKVYEQDNYTDQWTGQDIHGNELPTATYYYYIRQKSGEKKTGWIYISR